jgi:antitoxin CptB
MTETAAHRLKRMHMRSIRRGIKEMDLILGHFAVHALPGLDPADLDLYDALLAEPDQDLYTWVSGQVAPPDHYAALIARIAADYAAGHSAT